METIELRKAVETLLFIADSPVPLKRLCQIVGEADHEKVSGVVSELKREYDDAGRGIQVVEIAEGFQFATRPEAAPFVRKLYTEKMTMRLSTAALETLSIVAYRQPMTRAEVEEVRGVEVIAALESLLDKRLVKVVGRKETVGRPLLYGTTPEFLRHFGLRSIEDLPPLDTFNPADLPQDSVESSAANIASDAARAESDPLAAEPSPLSDEMPRAEGPVEPAQEAKIGAIEGVSGIDSADADAVESSSSVEAAAAEESVDDSSWVPASDATAKPETPAS